MTVRIDGYYFVVVHPSVEDDLRRIVPRSLWDDAYRAFRQARPQENLTPKQILDKFSDGLYLNGELSSILWHTFT